MRGAYGFFPMLVSIDRKKCPRFWAKLDWQFYCMVWKIRPCHARPNFHMLTLFNLQKKVAL